MYLGGVLKITDLRGQSHEMDQAFVDIRPSYMPELVLKFFLAFYDFKAN